MVACPGARTALLAILLLAPLASTAFALPQAVPPGAHVPLDAVALHVLATRLSDGSAITPMPGQNDTLLVRDQMIGVLAFLQAAQIQVSRTSDLEAHALALWRIARSYNHTADYYYVDVRTSNPCIELETNAWALAAAIEVSGAFGDEAVDARLRIEEVGDTLAAAIRGTAPVPTCDDGLRARALALWGVLRAASQADHEEAARALRAGLDEALSTRFDAAFHSDEGVYDVVANARLLVVLDGAARTLSEPRYAQARDALADFLIAHAVRTDGRDTLARSMLRDTPDIATGPVGPVEQLWLIHALEVARAATGAGAAQRDALMTTLVRRWWDPAGAGGLAGEDGALRAHANGLAAVIYSSPTVVRGAVERSEVLVAVRAVATATYPSPQASDASQWLLLNAHERRVTVSTTAQGGTTTYWPGAALGPFDLSYPVSPFYPAPNVVRVTDGANVPIVVDGAGFVRFTKAGAGPTEYLVKAYLPIELLDVAYGASITLRLRNGANEPLTVPRLVLETEARDVTFQSVTINGPTPVAFQAVEVPPNVYVDERHTRLVLSDVELRPGANTIAVGFEDLVGPQIMGFDLFEDRALTRPLERTADGVYTLLTSQPVWVGAEADDNTRVKQVNLVLRRPGGEPPRSLVLEPASDRPGWFRVQVRVQETGQATFELVAQDVKDNFSPTRTAQVDVRSSLLAGSSVVLFVFAAVLFLATAFIWLKIRRRHR